MKVLVFSDSHRSLRSMRDAVELEKPDFLIHLGDLEEDAENLAAEYPRLPLTSVAGNCDGWIVHGPLQRTAVYGGKRVLLSHGHIWRVKSGYDAAIAEARRAGVDILLFGHTHTAYCERMEDGLWVMNPGSVRDGDYGVIVPDAAKPCSLRHI